MSPERTNTTLLIFFFALCILCPIELCGQENEGEVIKYKWFDAIIGVTNSGVFKGVMYKNEYRVVNERHQFFESEDFKLGSVHYYGQEYFDVSLKYDIYLDNLLGVNKELANKPVVIFDKNGVEKFTIGDRFFENISNEMLAEGAGFFEVLFKNDSLILYKKYRKKVFKRTDEQVIYYEFKDIFSYFLFLENAFYPFKKAKELTRFFPKYKREIKESRKSNASLKKSSYDDYIKSVLSDILRFNPIKEEKKL